MQAPLSRHRGAEQAIDTVVSSRKRNFHEELAAREETKGSSDRAFGLTFAAVFALVGAFRWWSGGASAPYWLGAAAVFLLLGLVAPASLCWPNRAWRQLGLVLYRIVNPVVMGVLFYGVVTPMALFVRLRGKRPLQLRAEPEAASYWIERSPPGPSPATMKRQF